MRWLRGLIRGRVPGAGEAAEEETVAEAAAREPKSPRLVLLVHDATGLTSYRMHRFEDAEAAADFVQFWFPPTMEHGILAFWALHGQPVEQEAEVVILIRDEARPETVYPFSLPDMGMARSWVTKELARGLNPRSVMIYWATPVKIMRNRWSSVRLKPGEPPALRRQVLARSFTRVYADEPLGQHGAEPSEQRDELTGTEAEADDASTAAAPAEEPASELWSEGEGQEAGQTFDILEEAKKVVRERRFEKREGPFRGFGSPPGKF